MTDPKQVLAVCVDAGQTLLASGGEIFRVQETMERMAKAFGAEDFHVYVLTNGLFVSIKNGEGTHTSEVRHVPKSSVHMGRIIAVNALSRGVVAGQVSPPEAVLQLAEIRALPFQPKPLRIFACGIGAACFAYLFGGNGADALVALFSGFLLQISCLWLSEKSMSKIIFNILAATVAAVCSVAFAQLLVLTGAAVHVDKIIIGTIIPLVPGMALTTSIRDFANGDYLSGTIRLMDALLVAGSIAIGVGVVLVLTAFVPGVRL